MRALKGGENNSLGVTLIMKFNHILKCNHEIVINILQCLLNSTGHNYTCTCTCQDLLGIPTYEVRMDCEICLKGHNKNVF